MSLRGIVPALVLLSQIAAAPSWGQSDIEVLLGIEAGKTNQNTPDTEKLLKELLDRREMQSVGRVSSLSFPEGRSPQAKQSDYANPRHVIGIRGEGTPPSFIGHASKTGETEMISWNPKQGRYEFLILKNKLNAQGRPAGVSVTSAKREECMTCHQAGGPILSHFPWAESNFNQKVNDKIRDTQKDSSAEGLRLGIDGFGLDRLVREANANLQGAKICQTFCAGNIKCLRGQLAQIFKDFDSLTAGARGGQAFSLVSVSPNFTEIAFEGIFDRVRAAPNPLGPFLYSQSALVDRDPTIEPEKGGVATVVSRVVNGKGQVLNFNDNQSTQSIGGRGNFGFSSTYVRGVALGGVVHPATPRTKGFGMESFINGPINLPPSTNQDHLDAVTKLRGRMTVAACIRDPKILVSALFDFSEADLVKKIQDGKFDQFLKSTAWPASAEDILKISGIKQKEKPKSCVDENGMPIAPLQTESLKDIEQSLANFVQNANPQVSGPALRLSESEKKQAMADFKSLCVSCHGTGQAMTFSSPAKGFKFDFSNLDHLKGYGVTESGVLTKGSSTFLHALESQAMPPKEVADEMGLTPERRQRMIQLLKEP